MNRSLRGRVCIVTGATSGIGKEVTLELALRGATVAMVAREENRGLAMLEELRAKAKTDLIELFVADFSSLSSVRALAEKVSRAHPKISLLVNNAGTLRPQRALTVDGFEETFAVNHLAPFLLTHLLIDSLTAAAPARIVNVSSIAHRGVKLDFDDLMLERGYSGLAAYRRSKLANLLFSLEFSRRFAAERISSNAVHPGVVATNLGRGSSPWRLGFALGKLFMRSPRAAAKELVELAISSQLDGVTGAYFSRATRVEPSAAALDELAARKLWEISAKLTGAPVAARRSSGSYPLPRK